MAGRTKSEKISLEELDGEHARDDRRPGEVDDRQRHHHQKGVQNPIERGTGELPRRAEADALACNPSNL